MKTSTAENFMRSAKARRRSKAAVMPANVAWKAAGTIRGDHALAERITRWQRCSGVPDAMNNRSNPPMNEIALG